MFTSSPPQPFSSLSSLQNLPPLTHRGPLLRRASNYGNTRRTATPSITCSSDPLTSLGRLLWGRSLPPSLLVSTARSAWHATWHLFMRQLAPTTPSSSYSRPPSQFPTVPEPYRRYSHPSNLTLYAAHPCPWAHRTLLVLALKHNPLPSSPLNIKVKIVTPNPDGAWVLPENGVRLSEVYKRRRGGYEGRATVPMLWDDDKADVVCNESYSIIDFFNSSLDGINLAPEELRSEIERWNQIIYPNVNNGVYRCGFAQSQGAYDAAVKDLFATLDVLESHLSASRYLCGDALMLADVCLFTTLVRFDPVYNVIFKCTRKKLVEYPNLHAYMRDVYQIPNVAETCNLEAIMDGYYRILFPLNPGSIRPIVPAACEHECLWRPHGRESLSSSSKQPQLDVV